MLFLEIDLKTVYRFILSGIRLYLFLEFFTLIKNPIRFLIRRLLYY